MFKKEKLCRVITITFPREFTPSGRNESKKTLCRASTEIATARGLTVQVLEDFVLASNGCVSAGSRAKGQSLSLQVLQHVNVASVRGVVTSLLVKGHALALQVLQNVDVAPFRCAVAGL